LPQVAGPCIGDAKEKCVAFSEQQLRGAMGRFATGVTVVTTMTPDGPLGMTVNSFASVSLDPPLVLWSPARRSLRFPAFEAADFFAIHVLAVDQKDLAEAFALSGDAFEHLETAAGEGGTPLLSNCAARFECRHAAGHDGGDHLIVVGEVLRIEEREVAPLLYHRGGYCALGRA
jgi:4-hydroxyphenylacetate 3-hydroxylase, reductase component